MITFLTIWTIVLTGVVVGLVFRVNDLQRQVNVHHIDKMRKGVGLQDNETAG